MTCMTFRKRLLEKQNDQASVPPRCPSGCSETMAQLETYRVVFLKSLML